MGEDLGPPDPVADEWRMRLEGWRAELAGLQPTDSEAFAATGARVARAAHEAGLRAMPIEDQLRLQWTLVSAGLEQVALRGR